MYPMTSVPPLTNPRNLLRTKPPLMKDFKKWRFWGISWLTFCLVWGHGGLEVRATIAANSPDAPAEIKSFLMGFDESANNRKLNRVMGFYSVKLVHGDGLNFQTLQKSLMQLWKQYPNLTYQTELTSWQAEKKTWVLQTVTRISGKLQKSGQDVTLKSVIRSQQTVENQKIIRQEILSEQTQLTSGSRPPDVEVNLPETVMVGQSFSFDAIVKEPLGNDLMVGAVLEEPVNAGKYFNPQRVNLEPLSAGGLFKVGRAPVVKGSRWISAVLIRGDGVTRITQRLRVVDKTVVQPNRP